MQFRAYAGTDVGRHRDHNEDAFFLDNELGVFLVADGVGGHNAGEIASATLAQLTRDATPALRGILEEHRRSGAKDSRQKLLRQLPRVVEQANERIYQQSAEEASQRGMATTCVLFVPVEHDAFVCHVGDSRLYLFRGRQLYQITEDHSLVMQLYKRGLISKEDVATHPRKNVILRSVGGQPTVQVDTLYLDLLPGDVFLLCSDGLSDMVPEKELAGLMARFRGEQLVQAAIAAANRNGGFDNITALVVEIPERGETFDEAATSVRPALPMQEKIEFLQDLFLFAQLSDQECLKVNRVLYEQRYTAQQAVVREGEQGDELYMVARGQVDVWRNRVHLTTIGPGGHFGELGMLGNEVRSATVTARGECTLLVIRRADFMELVQGDPGTGAKVLWAFLENLATRVRDLSDRLAAKG